MLNARTITPVRRWEETVTERVALDITHSHEERGDRSSALSYAYNNASCNKGCQAKYVTCNNLFSPKELSANGGSISPILNGGRRRLLQGGFRKPRLNPEFMNRLDEYTKIVTEHLTEDLIQLSDIALTADGIPKLRLDHGERRLHIGADTVGQP